MMSRAVIEWEGLDAEELKSRWARPQVHVHGLVDSTNCRARALAESGAPAGTIVLADAQSAGRGLARRQWHSPAGSGLYVSVLLRPGRVPNPQLIPLLAGLGAARAVERSAVGVSVGLKWPNDLIVGDRKLGGVLSEGSWAGNTPAWLVVGIGINVHMQPDDFPEALRGVATSLDAAAGRRVSRLALADSVISEIEAGCNELPERLEGDLMERFARRDWLRGRPCVVEHAGGKKTRGVAAGVAPDGALLLRPEIGEPIAVTSGRISSEELPTPDY